MKRCILTIPLLLVSVLASVAKAPYRGEVAVGFGPGVKQGDKVTLGAEVDLAKLDLGRNDMLTFTPALRSLNGNEEMRFEPVSVAGPRRAKSIRRREYYHTTTGHSPKEMKVQTAKEKVRTIPLAYTLTFEPWMRNSRLVVVEQTAGCCNNVQLYADGRDYKLYQSDPYRFPEPYTPAYTVAFLTPPKVEAKMQSETYSARLQFQVNRSELLRNFQDNARILSEADEMINRIKHDSLLTVRRIRVQGYASPEGSETNNLRLSQERARAFVSYLYSQHNLYREGRLIYAEGMGEDWYGLRKTVEASNLDDKYAVLDILNNILDVSRRKNALKALSGGRTYRTMLEYMYPPLRRNEYTIEYEIRGFNAEEAQKVFKTRPQLLSLNEMFLVANLYQRDSEEFKQVFDVAARLFPDSPVAQFNVGAMEIENGSYDTAIKRLGTIETPDAWNNLGIAWWHKGDHQKAGEYLRKAAAGGNTAAIQNLQEFEKWSREQE